MLRKKIKICVLDDSEFYNRLLTRQLQNYTDIISAQKNFEFEINSYISPTDFVTNLKGDTDIVFLDFYLGNITALEIIKKVKEICGSDCKIIVISQARNSLASHNTINEGAMEYVHKDRNALARSCFIVEDIINHTQNNNWAFN